MADGQNEALTKFVLGMAAHQMAVQKILQEKGIADEKTFKEALQWAEQKLSSDPHSGMMMTISLITDAMKGK
jgi:hypothetical protein